MTTALILVEHGFQDEELVFPYYRMLEEGWEVTVASPDGKERIGKYGVPAKVTTTIGTLVHGNSVFDVLFIPGGFESPDRLREVESVKQIVNRHNEAQHIIAAICHGPWVLISAGICEGRTMTCYQSIRVDLENAGANYVNKPVVIGGNIVTAQHYRDNGLFMRTVIEQQRNRHVGYVSPHHL